MRLCAVCSKWRIRCDDQRTQDEVRKRAEVSAYSSCKRFFSLERAQTDSAAGETADRGGQERRRTHSADA